MIPRKQYNIMSFYLTRTLFIAGMFPLLCSTGKNDSLFGSILGMLLGYFMLYLFYKKGNIINSIKILLSILIISLSFMSNTILTSSFLLFTTPIIILIIPLIVIMIYSSKQGIRCIGRSIEIYHIVTILIIVICFIGLIKIVRISNILPMIQINIDDFIKVILMFSIISFCPNILLLDYKGQYKFKDISIGYILGCISIILLLFFILGIYGYEYASILRFPEYMILKRIHFMNYINNIENILVIEWIINIIISLMICGYSLYINLSKRIYYSILIILGIMMKTIVLNNYAYILFIKYYYWYLLGILIVFCYIKKEKC